VYIGSRFLHGFCKAVSGGVIFFDACIVWAPKTSYHCYLRLKNQALFFGSTEPSAYRIAGRCFLM
jgi:hypothetical protein